MPWNTDFKPKLIGKDWKWGENGRHANDDFDFKKGILEPDVFFAGLEDEIERVSKLMDDVE